MIPLGHTSVMASRREPPDSLEFFPTPPWATRALLRVVLPRVLGRYHIASAWDPCCGEGHMAEVLAEDVPIVHATDVFEYGRGYAFADFLDDGTRIAPGVDLIAMNPPFRPAVRFVLRALQQAPVVAALLRTQWLEGIGRYEDLHRDTSATLYAPFVERVPMVKGRWDPNASTATAYAWFVWVRDAQPQPHFLIPPGQRRELTLPSDIARFADRTTAPFVYPACAPAPSAAE